MPHPTCRRIRMMWWGKVCSCATKHVSRPEISPHNTRHSSILFSLLLVAPHFHLPPNSERDFGANIDFNQCDTRVYTESQLNNQFYVIIIIIITMSIRMLLQAFALAVRVMPPSLVPRS